MEFQALKALVSSRVEGRAHSWLTEACSLSATGDIPALVSVYTAAPRRVGRAALAASDAELPSTAGHDAVQSLDRWTVFDAARAVLLLAAAERLPSPDFAAAARAVYEQGDAGEQQSWLRALAWLPAPERFLDEAIDACRTNIVTTFEAIACENVYPERYFPTLHFNQMVLKAMFVGLPLDRIAGLDARLNPELSRMARDYRAERVAAGRPVPQDLARALNVATLEDTRR